MAGQSREAPGPPERATRRGGTWTAVACAPVLAALVVLMVYFAFLRGESDWVTAFALGLAATAVGARLVAVFRAGRGT